ncbi:MAG: 50S ribosomal protein L3 N(5)-glutamine methyltransferase [Gammaproteobacteria bacterium]|nr:50S ribosomal protein L3 N(5)-glutamine methyltransferase [Gammaproteobacteria bacterium]
MMTKINIDELAEELISLRDCIRWGVSAFNAAELSFVQGMPSALDEAVYLCLAALHLPPDFSEDYFDCRLTQAERRAVLGYYRQRIEQKKPAAYITNEAWFAGLSFYVDERVLIPRSPFAELIESHFQPWVMADEVHNILELCTGSGCIAIACAHAFEHANVVASDISADALAVAEINRHNYGLEDRLELVQSDLFENVPNRKYDLIVSNPPYVSEQEMAGLSDELKLEPALGLAAGELGLDVVIPMLKWAREFLSDSGILVVEVGYSWPALEAALPNVPLLWLDFEYGGEGVFMLTAEQLDRHRDDIEAL